MAALVVTLAGKTQAFELHEGHNLIGRHPDSPVSVPLPSVSWQHAVICVEAGQFTIEDVGSRNGTFVNRQRIRSRVRLNHNDAILFGNVPARFDNPAPTPPAADGPTGSSMVVDTKTTLHLGAVRLDIDDLGFARITGRAPTEGRFGGLVVNPQAKLKAVLEISNSLAGTVDLAALLPKILETLFRIFNCADRGCILLKDEGSGELVPRAMQHRRPGGDDTVHLSRTVINKVLTEKAGILSADAAVDAQFSGSQSIADLKIRSMMCVPLLGLDGQVLGILSLDSQNSAAQFSRDDLEILMTVAGQAALSYENARLVQLQVEKQKQDRELELARNVQLSLLPVRRPPFPDRNEFTLDAVIRPARIMAGDFFDFWFVQDDVLAVLIADVSGKGVPAAMFMAVARTLLRVMSVPGRDPAEVLTLTNRGLAQNNDEFMFVTVFFGHYHVRTGELVFANGGHNPPYVLRADGSLESLGDSTGPMVGVIPEAEYSSRRIVLAGGEILVLYTDGVTEAANDRREFLGQSGLQQILTALPSHNVEEICRTVLRRVDEHRDSPDQDDVTVLALGRG